MRQPDWGKWIQLWDAADSLDLPEARVVEIFEREKWPMRHSRKWGLLLSEKHVDALERNALDELAGTKEETEAQ